MIMKIKNKIKNKFTKSKDENFNYDFENLFIAPTLSGKTDPSYLEEIIRKNNINKKR